jgi:hypothetical protein
MMQIGARGGGGVTGGDLYSGKSAMWRKVS